MIVVRREVGNFCSMKSNVVELHDFTVSVFAQIY
jgi:hypothetical protein